MLWPNICINWPSFVTYVSDKQQNSKIRQYFFCLTQTFRGICWTVVHYFIYKHPFIQNVLLCLNQQSKYSMYWSVTHTHFGCMTISTNKLNGFISKVIQIWYVKYNKYNFITAEYTTTWQSGNNASRAVTKWSWKFWDVYYFPVNGIFILFKNTSTRYAMLLRTFEKFYSRRRIVHIASKQT